MTFYPSSFTHQTELVKSQHGGVEDWWAVDEPVRVKYSASLHCGFPWNSQTRGLRLCWCRETSSLQLCAVVWMISGGWTIFNTFYWHLNKLYKYYLNTNATQCLFIIITCFTLWLPLLNNIWLTHCTVTYVTVLYYMMIIAFISQNMRPSNDLKHDNFVKLYLN